MELEADFDVRLARNVTPNRLEYKPLKRDIEKSEKDLRDTAEKYRLNSYEGELKYKNYLRINNTHMSPEDVAQQIQQEFKL